jgi:hypothetical protein
MSIVKIQQLQCRDIIRLGKKVRANHPWKPHSEFIDRSEVKRSQICKYW